MMMSERIRKHAVRLLGSTVMISVMWVVAACAVLPAPTATPQPTLFNTPLPTMTPLPKMVSLPSPAAIMSEALLRKSILWSADHETANLSQWYYPEKGPVGNYGGGKYNSGNADSIVSKAQAHSGAWSVKMTITTPHTPTSGTRLFRWDEPSAYSQLYYSVWFYFPQRYSIRDWWNVFQWKSRRVGGDPSVSDPMWIIGVSNRATGAMYFTVGYWPKQITYKQTIMDIPVGRWTHVEAFLKKAADATGHITVWQDGVQLYDYDGVRTTNVQDMGWSVDNYSNLLSPNPATIYADDAVISTARIGETRLTFP